MSMKKLLLMTIVMMASTSVFAQREPGTLTLQPRVGLVAADFSTIADTKARVGVFAGAELEYHVSSAVGLSAGVYYAQQGTELTDHMSPYTPQPGAEWKDHVITWKLDYLNIPIVANFYVWKGLAIKAGLQPGFKLSSKEEGELGGKRTTFNLDDEVNNFDVAVPLGISYDFGHLVLDARYTIGLKRILKDKSDLDCKNITFQIGLGYKFRL